MSEAVSVKTRDRSPSYPFVHLQAAVERMISFENYFKRYPAPIDKVGLAWGMKEKSSQSDQTLAAMRAYGLIEYQGTTAARHAVLSEDGRMYLRAQQESIKQQVLKRAALRPKAIRKFWSIWGADRPPDPVSLDQLVISNGFSDTGARAFLKVYDATISYAGLSDSDKSLVDFEAADGNDEDQDADNIPLPLPSIPPPAPPPSGKGIVLMAGERELTTGLLAKEASFRLIVTGQIGVKEIERLIRKLELDKEILAEVEADRADRSVHDGDPDGT